MIIESPFYLLLLLIILPVGGLAFSSYLNGRKNLQKLGGGWRFESLLNVFIVKNFFVFLFFVFFIIFLVLALADIRWDEQLVEDDREGYEIAVLLDISRSMLADDVLPTRLQAAAEKIGWLVNNLPGSRFSIVIFKGKAVLIMPATDDVYALSLFLNTVSPDQITVPGSNLEDGINVALDSFFQAGKFRLILLFTDGENKSGNPVAAAKKAGEAGIPIIPVIMGKDQGANIRLGPGNYLRNDAGKMVVSKADILLLKEIAESSNGRTYSYNDFYRIRDEIPNIAKRIENENIDKGLKPVKNEKFELFLCLGILFLTLSVLTRGVRWKEVT